MLIVRIRLNPVHNTPLKVGEKCTKEKQQVICLIYDVAIIKSSYDVLGDDMLFTVKETVRAGCIVSVYVCQNHKIS